MTPIPPDPPLSPRVRQAISHARDAARELGHECVGTGHLLVGLLRAEDGHAAAALKWAGVDHPRLAEAMRVLLLIESAPAAGG